MAIDGLDGRRILILEDESLILLTLQEIVEELGCQVAGTAMHAEAAIGMLSDRPVDAAILDVNLGGGRTSYPVAESLATRGIPFVFVTGYAPSSLLADYRDRPVLSKPVDQRRLAAVLRRLVAPAQVEER